MTVYDAKVGLKVVMLTERGEVYGEIVAKEKHPHLGWCVDLKTSTGEFRYNVPCKCVQPIE